MTTVVFRDGVLAADTMITCDGVRDSHMAKIAQHGRLLIGFAGATKNYEAFRDWVKTGMQGRFESKDGNVFIVPPTGPAVMWGDGDRPWREVGPFWALGSGASIALGALEAGYSAPQAVQVAARRDTSTGGQVTVLTRIIEP